MIITMIDSYYICIIIIRHSLWMFFRPLEIPFTKMYDMVHAVVVNLCNSYVGY